MMKCTREMTRLDYIRHDNAGKKTYISIKLVATSIGKEQNTEVDGPVLC